MQKFHFKHRKHLKIKMYRVFFLLLINKYTYSVWTKIFTGEDPGNRHQELITVISKNKNLKFMYMPNAIIFGFICSTKGKESERKIEEFESCCGCLTTKLSGKCLKCHLNISLLNGFRSLSIKTL